MSPMRFLRVPAGRDLLVWLVLTTPVLAQDLWSRIHGVGPSARRDAAMVFDGARGEFVLFGGSDGSAPLADTWMRRAGAWVATTATGPSARSGHAMAFDAVRGRVVLFGGHDGTLALGDTWTWDGNAWSPVPVVGPSDRWDHAMAFDQSRGTVVLFGGRDDNGELGETWEWDGVAWTPVAVAGPSARAGHRLAYDDRAGECLLFGGIAAGVAQNDTWRWSGGTWQQVSAAGPAPRSGHAMTFDPHRDGVVMFGGAGASANPLSDAWRWSGETDSWSPIPAAGPTARDGAAMAFDPVTRWPTMFGGAGAQPSDDTWVLSCAPWCDLGYATGGLHGPPSLIGSGPLEGGTSMSLALDNVRAQSAGALILGASAAHLPVLGGTMVPAPVVAVGFPVGGSSGTPASAAIGPLAIPVGSPFGAPLYFQCWIADAAAPAGLAVSNAIVGVVRPTLREAMISEFDAVMSAAAAPAQAKPIYSSQDFVNRVFVRNPSCWAARYDLTGISPWNQANANTRAGTLVSPRHVVFAKHYPLSTTPGNNDIVFVTRDNVTVTRQLISVLYPAADIGVGLLDSDVPADVTFYRVLPQDWATHLPNANNLPMLHLDQEEKALVRNMDRTVGGALYVNHKTPPAALRSQFSETLIGGDSGNPAFLIVQDEPVLVLTHHFATGGPFYTTYRDQVNAAMTQLGGGYQLSEVDLAGVAR